MTTRKQEIAHRFGRAAPGYDRAAGVQRVAADGLAHRILSAGLPPRPRILEIGCGTGLLTRLLLAQLPDADWTITDLSIDMLLHCRTRLAASPSIRLVAMDAEAPSVGPGFDLICGGLAMQWFDDRSTTLRGLAALLNRGGLLALSTLCAGSFTGWRASLAAEAAADAMPHYPTHQALQADWPGGGAGQWQIERVLDRHRDGIDFLRSLRAIGADLPRPGALPLPPSVMRRVLRRFETAHASIAEYRIGYGLFRKPSRDGVFVTGTDTGVGKTLVSACLAKAWDADYWKPLQTGLRDEAGDTATVMHLGGLTADRTHPPAYALQAPLAPEPAAALENVTIDLRALALPPASAVPLVVEGAGGLMVPIEGDGMMIDLIRQLALPVVLVARGTLGTINHTMLSLEALRARGIPIAGVIVNGVCTAGNRHAIEHYGRVRIIAEIPELETPGPDAVARAALLIPPLASVQ